MPGECLTALLELSVPVEFIHGNGERGVLGRLEPSEMKKVPEPLLEAMQWVGKQLPPEQPDLLGSWPLTVQLQIPDIGAVLFCHATPRSDNEIFTRLTPEERLAPIFEATNADLVVCGHTHMQFDRQIGDVRVVNAGSVGMPFGRAGAYWLLLGNEIELRHTSYDLEAAAERIRKSDYPQAESFASGHILQRPSEQEMLERFEQAAIA